MLRGNLAGNESDVRSVLSNVINDNVVIVPWYYSREEIEKNSPSRGDGIGLKKETRLRKSYCTFLRELGKKLKVPQIMIATAIVFCHRFFLRQSHAKNDKWTIAIACMFLAGKVEETPRALRDVIIVSYEMITKKNLAASQRKEVYEQQKEIVLSGEELVLATLNFDLSVCHPYRPLVVAIKKYKALLIGAFKTDKVEEAEFKFPGVAWNFVNDSLCWTTLCLQYKPCHIAAGAFFLAAKLLKVDLQSYEESLYKEFDITPRQLEDICGQMLDIYDVKHIPASQGSIVESSDPVHQPVSRDIASTNKDTQNQTNDNGSSEAGSVITEQKWERERGTKDIRDVSAGDALVSQSANELKLLRDRVKAKLEAKKKLQGERTRMKDLVDEDDLIEKELEDLVLAVEDDKDKQQNSVISTEHGDILVDDGTTTMPSRKRKMGSPSENQLGGGKRRHDNS